MPSYELSSHLEQDGSSSPSSSPKKDFLREAFKRDQSPERQKTHHSDDSRRDLICNVDQKEIDGISNILQQREFQKKRSRYSKECISIPN